MLSAYDCPAAATKVTVLPPVISSQPAASTVKVNANAIFKLVAKTQAGVTFQYQWQRLPVGTSIWANLTTTTTYSGATTASLTVKNVSLTMSRDQFRGVVSDSAGSNTTNSSTLLVENVPAIILQPVPDAVMAPGAANFTVVAYGVPVPTYQWQRKPAASSTWAKLAKSAIYANVTTASLTVNTTTLAMSGDQFECVVKNSLGSVTSVAANLTVTPSPASITTQPVNKSANLGGSVQFAVVAAGIPTPALQWQISSDGGASWSNLTGSTNATLTVGNVTAAMAGDQFRCQATNSAGSAVSNAATLTVNLAPKITTQPSNQTLFVGGSATFTVSATGTPPPVYQWKKNGQNIPGAINATLTLSNLQSTDAANYTVTVSNLVGNVTSAVAILVVNAFTVDISLTRGTIQFPNKYTGWTIGGGAATNFVAYPAGSGWTVGGGAATNFVAVPPGWSVGGGSATNFIALAPGWTRGGGSLRDYVALPPGWSTGGGSLANYVALPPGFTTGGGSATNYIALPPGWKTSGGSATNYIALPPSGWTVGGGSATNFVGLAAGWSTGGGSATNYVALPPGWTTGGRAATNYVAVAPGWLVGGGAATNFVAYPGPTVTTIEIAFNDPGWLGIFQQMQNSGSYTPQQLADIILCAYLNGAGVNASGMFMTGI